MFGYAINRALEPIRDKFCIRIDSIMSPISKVKLRRAASRRTARDLLQDLVAGKVDTYEAYRRLWGLWCTNNAGLQELRPLFRIEGIEPEGCFSVTAEFREQVLSLANEILPNFSD